MTTLECGQEFVEEQEVTISTEEFWDHVEKISQIVEKWPEWKRNIYNDDED